MLCLLCTLLAFTPGISRADPIPPPHEKEVFRFTIITNTREGFEKANQLTLTRDGNLYTTNGRRVKDDDIGSYCISDLEKRDQKVVLAVLNSADISASKLIETLEKIQKAAQDQKIHLTVNVLTRSP